MKKIAISVLVVIVVCLSLAARSNQNVISPVQQKNIGSEILKVHQEMKKAAESLDADALFTHVLDVNDVIIENGALRSTLKNAYDVTKQGFQGIKELSYTYNHTNINVISQTTVLWTGNGTTTAMLTDGRKITIDFAETIVFILSDGRWKVLHAHRSSPN
jgi:hypothetical protein